MKIQDVNLKEKLFFGIIIIACVGLVITFSIQAIQDLGHSVIIMPTHEYEQLQGLK